MNPWLETAGVVLLAGGGVFLGHWFSKLRKPYWAIGYFIPLLLILVHVWANHQPALAMTPPVSWMLLGRNRFAVFGVIAAMVLTTPLARLPRKRDRIMVSVLMAVIVWRVSIWPFLAPAFNQNYLAALQTRMDADGVCRQSNDYTCGPAAAVTALRRLDLPADEGEIAILAHTSTATGTPPDILARALQRRYAESGLTAEYRVFNSAADLKEAGLTLAIVKFSFMIDHYVTVLEVTDEHVIVGDPLTGIAVLSHEEFEGKWRYLGVVLRRDP